MAGLADSGSNPDVDLLYDINGLAKDAPHWLDPVSYTHLTLPTICSV